MKNDNKSFLKSISILTAGSAVSILFLAIQHIALPYIFTPEELGIKSVILAIPTACAGIICGRYDLTLVYEEDENRINHLIWINVFINLSLSSFITLICLFDFIFIDRRYIQYWYLLPAIWIYLVSYGLTSTLNAINNRYRDYKKISILHSIRTAAQCLGTVVLGYIFVHILQIRSLSVFFLVVPYCVGMACGIWSQSKEIRENAKEIVALDRKAVWEVAKQHKKQPLLSAPAILANSFSYSLITMIMNWVYGEATTGYYSLSITLLGLPITLISNNLSKVYMKDAAKEYEQTGGFIKSFKKNFVFLIALAVPMFFAMYFVAPPICTWLFGAKWKIAGIYIKALSVMFCFRLVSSALSPGLYICRKQTAELIIQGSLLVVTVISGLIGYFGQFDAESFLRLLGLLRSVVMAAHITIVWYYSRKVVYKNE